jgi:hypothetical protein
MTGVRRQHNFRGCCENKTKQLNAFGKAAPNKRLEVKADDLKSKTKAILVELLVRQAYEATAIAQAINKRL